MHFMKATPHCSNRAVEWITALIQLLIGAVVLFAMTFVGVRVIGAFKVFAHYGLTEFTVAVSFVLIGCGRMVALHFNGKWDSGPIVRAGCAFVGVFIWWNLLYGILDILFTTHELFISCAAWAGLLVGEIHSFSRAILDQKTPVRPTDAITGS